MIEFDLHTHSIASGHGTTDTITMMIDTALQKGLKLLGITEHGPARINSCKTSYYRGVSNLPRTRKGLRLFYGCELNILDVNGTVDLDQDILSKLDINIASLHTANIKPGSMEANTNAIVNAMRNPYIHIIGHPDDMHFPLDYERIVKEAVEQHVLLELNAQSVTPNGFRTPSRDAIICYLTLCKKMNHPIILGSDSHGCENIANFDACCSLLQSIDFPETLILNYQLEQLLSWVSKH